MADCMELLTKARAKLQEYDEFIDELMDKPRMLALVVGTTNEPNRYVAMIGGNVTTIFLAPEEVVTKLGGEKGYKPKTGDLVWVLNGAIIGRTEMPPIGSYVTITSTPKDGFVELDGFGQKRRIFVGKIADVKPGDKVLLDPSGYVATYKQPPVEEPAKRPTAQVTWNHVGGLNEAKTALRDAIEVPYKHPEIFKGYDTRPPKGILLLGPPGCGKTMLGKAAANALAEIHGKGQGSGFIYIKGPEVLSKWVGEAEANIRDLFTQAKKHKEKYGYDAIVFIDEADALLGARGSGVGSITDTVVPAFLTEMDGMEDTSAIVVLATNRPQLLDPAVTRDGRVDRKIRVSRPDRDTAREILAIHARGGSKAPTREMLDDTISAIWSDELPLIHVRSSDGQLTGFLRDNVSGALLHGVVKRAKAQAIRRDIEQKAKKASGVTRDDLLQSVYAAWNETRFTRLDELARELCDARGATLQSFAPVHV